MAQEEQEHITWGGVLVTLPEYIWNVLVLSGSEEPTAPIKSKIPELQAKSLHDFHPPPSTHNQIMLRAEKSIQTPSKPHPVSTRNLCSITLVSITQLILLIALFLSISLEIFHDFQHKFDQQILESALKSANCAKEYTANQCEPETRIPIAEEFCREKEACMHQNEVYTLKTVAMVLGDTVESFVGAMSWRTLAFLGGVGVVVGKVVVGGRGK